MIDGYSEWDTLRLTVVVAVIAGLVGGGLQRMLVALKIVPKPVPQKFENPRLFYLGIAMFLGMALLAASLGMVLFAGVFGMAAAGYGVGLYFYQRRGWRG